MIRKEVTCGTLQSNDCFVRLKPSTAGVELKVESTVYDSFGEQIEKVAKETLKAMGITDAILDIDDKGALDYTIRARIETAVRRANG